jgi:hypothetical protein
MEKLRPNTPLPRFSMLSCEDFNSKAKLARRRRAGLARPALA